MLAFGEVGHLDRIANLDIVPDLVALSEFPGLLDGDGLGMAQANNVADELLVLLEILGQHPFRRGPAEGGN